MQWRCSFFLTVLTLVLTVFVTLVQTVPRSYYLIQQNKTWSEAQAYCRENYIDLATYETQTEVGKIQTEALKYGFSSKAWIGFHTNASMWYWSLDNEPLGSMRWWLPGQPDNGGGRQFCGSTGRNGWWDDPCTDQYPFLCYDDRYNGTDRYIYNPNASTWNVAQSYCRLHHTDLVSTRDSSEISTVVGKMIYVYAWIGLYKEPWKWSDGTNSSYITWRSGQPDNYYRNESCAYLSGGLVYDTPCSDQMPFYCYSGLSRRQKVIRLKIQSVGTLNITAVQTVLFQKMKLKLMERGVANFTLTIKKQPNGTAFQKTREDRLNYN